MKKILAGILASLLLAVALSPALADLDEAEYAAAE